MKPLPQPPPSLVLPSGSPAHNITMLSTNPSHPSPQPSPVSTHAGMGCREHVWPSGHPAPHLPPPAAAGALPPAAAAAATRGLGAYGFGGAGAALFSNPAAAAVGAAAVPAGYGGYGSNNDFYGDGYDDELPFRVQI